MGRSFATRSGLSICIADTNVKTDREKIIAQAERDVQRPLVVVQRPETVQGKMDAFSETDSGGTDE